MKLEKIENRLKELYDEYQHVTDKDIVWIKQTGGLTRRERIEKCKILIEELKTLSNAKIL
jgi:archaellum component FlaC